MHSAPKTIEEARRLPEIDKLALMTSKFGVGFDLDDICIFTDVDGSVKQVVDTDKGYFKAPL